MRALVAGATGFIGRHLVARLRAGGHDVRALVRPTSDTSSLEGQGVEVRAGSLLDERFLKESCRGIDVVYNLIGRLGGWRVSAEDMRQANVGAVRSLLEACRGSGVSQFVHCSTPGVVGMSGVASELLPYRPAALYEQTKCEAETIALGSSSDSDTAVTVARPDFVYGPGDYHKLKLFRALRDRRFLVIGDGKSLLHPTYVDDVVDGLLLVAGNEKAFGEVFNFAGPEPVTVLHLANAIAGALGVAVPTVRIPVPVARAAAGVAEVWARITGAEPALTRYQVSFFTRDHASDISKAKSTLGYFPKVGAEDGVRNAVTWYREQGLL